MEKKVRVDERNKLFRLAYINTSEITEKIFGLSRAKTMVTGAETGLPGAGAESTQETQQDHHPGLHLYAKFILLSSFLASHNPARLDAQCFGKTCITARRRRRRGRAANDTVLGGKKRQKLKGRKAFPMERMLAIFSSLINEPVMSDVAIHSQIATLVSLRYLSRVSRYAELDMPKFRCNISYDMAKNLAQDVRVDLDGYLHDFVSRGGLGKFQAIFRHVGKLVAPSTHFVVGDNLVSSHVVSHFASSNFVMIFVLHRRIWYGRIFLVTGQARLHGEPEPLW